MDSATIGALLEFASKLDPGLLHHIVMAMLFTPIGVVVLILLFWWINERKRTEMLAVYREDVMKLGRFYETNVELVKSWERVADSLQDIVVLNTKTLQRVVDICLNNEFCPNQRSPRKNGERGL